MAKEMSRRTFLKQGAAAAIGLAVVPSTVLGKKFGYTAPSDKLNILGVGVGGRGASVLKGLESQNIIGLCDVDWKYADHIFKRYPAAKKFNDYRKMYDEMLKSADAVMVATADHTHAIIAADAITAGKHVYCEKPLTHTVYESRLLTKLADKYKVATQMGNQGASAEGVRKVCEWIWNGEIGEVRRVDTFTDRPIWPQGLARPEEDMAVPKTMNWDAFIGPAPYRPYNAAYTPWNFRGWWDFGTGALGDLGCHALDLVSFVTGKNYRKAVGHTDTYVTQRRLEEGEGYGPVDVDDFCHYLMEMDGKTSANFSVTRFAYGRGNYQRMEIYGSKGGLVYSLDVTPGVDELEVCFGYTYDRSGIYTKLPIPQRFQCDQMQSFADILNGCSDGMAATIQDGCRIQHALDVIIRSAEEEKWLPCD